MKTYEKLKALIDEIDVLISHGVSNSDLDFIKWQKKAERFLKSYYHEGDEYKDFINTSFGVDVWSFNTSDSSWVEACADGLRETKAIFEVYLEELQNSDDKEMTKVSDKKISNNNNRVFVVHGHDGELRQSIARTLERQGIEPIILAEQANLGATIIEKFEKYSDVSAAICLFTDDDLGKANNEDNLKPRARQNVVFEAGYFIGKLGRENVVLLANSNIEMPSDLSGVVYTNNSMWEMQVLKELKEMGFIVDLNKVL